MVCAARGGKGMANFFAELKRRHIYRVAAAYAVVAWLLLQLIANVAPILELPPWVARAFLLLLVVGFPLAIVLAWTREPEGDPTQRAMTGKLDWALMGALVVVIALVSYQQLAPVSGTATATQEQGVEAARSAASSPTGAVSIAVLPFANLSGDASQEFFSDGMTEEITSALARVPDLRVVARTSAYQFRDQNRDIQSIGQQLRATHFIEGSVRKAGDRVRITAQLIKSDDGTHVWAENYDRELTNVFAIQEEIARAIATSLHMPLGLRPGGNLVSGRAIDPESYQEFLRAKAQVSLRARGVGPAIEILEPLVARNPDYAPAWALLAQAYQLTPLYRRNSVDALRSAAAEFLPKAEGAARRAIQLDPNLANSYLPLAQLLAKRGQWLQAEDAVLKALALDPNYPDALQWHGIFLSTVGRVKESLVLQQHVLAVEPLVPGYRLDAAEALWLDGQTDAAIEMLKELPMGGAKIDLATVYASHGRYNEAADVLLTIAAGAPNQPLLETITEATRLLRAAPTAGTSSQDLPRLGTLAFVYVHVGAPGRILEPYEEWAGAGYVVDIGFNFLWHPSYAPVRKLDRFKAYARKAGFVDYWRAKGWPDACSPTSGDDFVCN